MEPNINDIPVHSMRREMWRTWNMDCRFWSHSKANRARIYKKGKRIRVKPPWKS